MADRALWRLSALAGLCALTMAIYSPTLGYDFVYEDRNDPTMFQSWVGVTAQPFRALSRAAWTFAEWRGRGQPWAYHALSVETHLLNGWLLAALVSSWIGVFVVGVFWLHPLQVESVAYISAYPDLLAVTCCLLALLAVKHDRWWLAATAVVVAVFVKETALVTWALVACYAWSLGRRVPTAWWSGIGVPLAVSLLMAGWYHWSPTFSADYTLTTVAVATRYLAWTVWPIGLSVDHDWTWTTPLVGAACLMPWALFARVAWTRFAVIWTALALAPRLLVSYGDGLHDHHWGIVLVGWCLAFQGVNRD